MIHALPWLTVPAMYRRHFFDRCTRHAVRKTEEHTLWSMGSIGLLDNLH